MLRFENPPQFVLFNQTDFTSGIKRMRSDAPYTALLVARGDDDDEFRREDVARSKDNSTAYSSRGRERDVVELT